MGVTVVVMVLTLLIPLYTASRRCDIWEKMLSFASIATKTTMALLALSVWRDDWMIGLVGVLILSVGNAALMLLAHVLRKRCLVEIES